MKLSYSGCSQPGLVRKVNQDSYLMRVSDQAALFLVADGIGGKKHGDVVSGMLRDGYEQWYCSRSPFLDRSSSLETAMDEIKQVLFTQNREVVRRYGKWKAGSTLVLLFFLEDRYLYLSVGDSRLYRAGKGTFQQLTRDDSYENFGNPREGAEPEVGEKLVGAVGIRPDLEFSIGTGKLRRKDRFFLCSDGVYRYVSPKKLKTAVGGWFWDPDRLIIDLSRQVEKSGGGDNYSMICVQVNSL